MKYLLLTGATGLLGRYLLRDMTLAELPLAVVVRRSRSDTAVQRIETAMAHWEQQLGRTLVRPVVLEGDITECLCGLSPYDQAWVAEHCEAILHSAASLTFYAEDEQGEPWRSNIQGTRNVLDLCRQAGIRQMHHVSTAYVCGQRRGRVLETELDLGQEPSNDYERSKITAEKEVLAADCFDRVTVYRPSIIVGDSVTGYTTSYHGFYTPLRLMHSVVQAVSWEQILAGDWLGGLALTGNERKNLVPVEWVSAAMTALVANPACHGRTYHLTNPRPATVGEMTLSIAAALYQYASSRPAPPARELSADNVASFREQMKVYQSYWSDDPQFDSSATEAALPHLPCPEISPEVMQRLIEYALATNFGWPREQAILPPVEVGSRLAPWIAARPTNPANAVQPRYVSLFVSGRGGGQWHLTLDDSHLVGAAPGLRNGDSSTCYMNSATFARLTGGQMNLEDAINSGRLIVAGNAVRTSELANLFRTLSQTDQHAN